MTNRIPVGLSSSAGYPKTVYSLPATPDPTGGTGTRLIGTFANGVAGKMYRVTFELVSKLNESCSLSVGTPDYLAIKPRLISVSNTSTNQNTTSYVTSLDGGNAGFVTIFTILTAGNITINFGSVSQYATCSAVLEQLNA